MPPIQLTTQEQFEDLWFARKPDTPQIFLIWFTARWCSPCQRMDKASLESAAHVAGVPFYICDATVNEYTPGYCDVRAFPTFILFKPQKILAQITNSDVYRVGMWISSEVANAQSRLQIVAPPVINSMTKPKVELKKTM
jgi:hypothetical protein